MLAGLASLIIPGVGQLMQGRFVTGLMVMIVTGLLWCIGLGYIMHVVAAVDAAIWKPKVSSGGEWGCLAFIVVIGLVIYGLTNVINTDQIQLDLLPFRD